VTEKLEQWRGVVLPQEYRDFLEKCDGLARDDSVLVLCGCEPHEFDVDTETISVMTLVEANDWDLDDCYAIAVGSFGVDFIVYEGRQNLFGLADRDEVKVYRAWPHLEDMLKELTGIELPLIFEPGFSTPE